MQFINMTPHPLNISGTHIPVGELPTPRLEVTREQLGELGGFSMVRSTMGAPTGLPEEQEGVVLIVSALVAEHPSVAHRGDLAYPGEAIRDENGRIVGAKGLCAGPGLARRMLS